MADKYHLDDLQRLVRDKAMNLASSFEARFFNIVRLVFAQMNHIDQEFRNMFRSKIKDKFYSRNVQAKDEVEKMIEVGGSGAVELFRAAVQEFSSRN
jgi:hypothetical protein